jgi:pantoate--beta-alanine ligase
MQVIEQISEMRRWSETARGQGKRIVLVPTMGSLHEGHLSLVRDGKNRGDRLVVSIFVNPAQFAPNEDFAGYPRDFERDRELLERERVDIVFHPSVEEMYPPGHQSVVDVGLLSLPLCGAFRPGHFRGVATIVAKLFNIIRPHLAIFGLKDYQQWLVIRRMVRDLDLAVDMVGHPTVREADGLALSSRNAYLNPEQHKAALCLCRSLRASEALVKRGEKRATVILDAARLEIAKEPLARLEYASLCDPENLAEVERVQGAALLALAVWIGKARLIDNTILKP